MLDSFYCYPISWMESNDHFLLRWPTLSFTSARHFTAEWISLNQMPIRLVTSQRRVSSVAANRVDAVKSTTLPSSVPFKSIPSHQTTIKQHKNSTIVFFLLIPPNLIIIIIFIASIVNIERHANPIFILFVIMQKYLLLLSLLLLLVFFPAFSKRKKRKPFIIFPWIIFFLFHFIFISFYESPTSPEDLTISSGIVPEWSSLSNYAWVYFLQLRLVRMCRQLEIKERN